MSIKEDVPLKFTCGVCGKPLNPVLGGLPGIGGTGICVKCGKTVCSEHLRRKDQVCTRCSGEKKDWCGTPGIFKP